MNRKVRSGVNFTIIPLTPNRVDAKQANNFHHISLIMSICKIYLMSVSPDFNW